MRRRYFGGFGACQSVAGQNGYAEGFFIDGGDMRLSAVGQLPAPVCEEKSA